MKLIAPEHLRGRMTRWSDRETLAERLAWILARGAEGHNGQAISEALGIKPAQTYRLMNAAGYRWWHQKRIIRRCKPHQNERRPQKNGAL